MSSQATKLLREAHRAAGLDAGMPRAINGLALLPSLVTVGVERLVGMVGEASEYASADAAAAVAIALVMERAASGEDSALLPELVSLQRVLTDRLSRGGRDRVTSVLLTLVDRLWQLAHGLATDRMPVFSDDTAIMVALLRGQDPALRIAAVQQLLRAASAIEASVARVQDAVEMEGNFLPRLTILVGSPADLAARLEHLRGVLPTIQVEHGYAQIGSVEPTTALVVAPNGVVCEVLFEAMQLHRLAETQGRRLEDQRQALVQQAFRDQDRSRRVKAGAVAHMIAQAKLEAVAMFRRGVISHADLDAAFARLLDGDVIEVDAMVTVAA
jgi:hypothetical protein